MMKNYPRILVLSNNSFSTSNSNGRTLGSLLKGWPKDCIAQFCISSDGADFDVCENYYCVTDADVMKSVLKFKPAVRRNLTDRHIINANLKNGYVRHRKSSLKMLARNIAWQLGLWKGKGFAKWISDFNPEIILLQNGDSYFMHSLALHIAKKTGARLAMFNTEANYLFKNDYFKSDGVFGKILFKLYSAIYKHNYRRFMKMCAGVVYGNELLRNDYGKEFGVTPAMVIYTGSELEFEPAEIKGIPVFSYFGNMGFDRPSALIEFAETINKIDSRYVLDVYGFVKDKMMEDLLRNCKSIRFHGAVSYSEVIKATKNSDFLVHVETQSEEWQETLRYGFSTKIADSIASGKIFVLYSSPEIACAQYIKDTGAGILVSDLDDLRQKIKNVLEDIDYKEKINQNARIVAKNNHSPQINQNKTYIFLTSLPKQ